jgi:hypothetical protein
MPAGSLGGDGTKQNQRADCGDEYSTESGLHIDYVLRKIEEAWHFAKWQQILANKHTQMAGHRISAILRMRRLLAKLLRIV